MLSPFLLITIKQIIMRKQLITLTLLTMSGLMLQARPVATETAKDLARAFVTSNFESSRQSSELTLVQTAFSDRGEACYYIFNVGETGFVIMAADDNYRPIIGYSDRGTFDVDDMAPALTDYLENVRQSVAQAALASAPSASVAADWKSLERSGRMVSRHGGRPAEFIVATTWNQNYPYNYFCPAAPAGPGGRCYAGCVATAAAQLMKYWDHPLHGTGSYSYIPEDHPEYGPLYVNFGEATYDWDNMPNSISANSPQVQIEAVAQLIYHAGVCVDMNYHDSSSGAVTTKLCQRMPQFFNYTPAMVNYVREDYSHEDYMQLVIDAIDMRWPMVHRGGGHAYVLDGYDDNDMVHFNWGWGGSSDGWFNIDEHNYTEGESVIYNYVPADIYAATADAPTNLVVTPSNDNSHTANLVWQNPTLNLGNTLIETIDQVLVLRDGQVIYTEDNVAPGEAMSYTDENVPFYDKYEYAVCAVVNGQRGKSAIESAYVGPTCNWRIIMQSTAFQGWNGGYVSLYSNSGKEIERYTITNSVPVTLDISVPLGHASFGWTAPQTNVNNLTFTIKDADGNTVYTYSGAAFDLEPGIFLEVNNGCGNTSPLQAPFGLVAEITDENAVLTWNQNGAQPDYGFLVYRDEQLYGSSLEPVFVDENISEGHCYTVAALFEGGESEQSNETCASSGDCMSATNFDFEITGSNYRVKLLWDRPENSEGLSGYYLYRKNGDDGTYQRIKLISGSATSYTDNTTTQEGFYSYRLYAYYSANDCTSAPASVKDNPNLFYLRVYYSPTEVEEAESQVCSVYPNPVSGMFTIDANGLNKVVICNMLGQVVYEAECDSDRLTINASDWTEGLYVVEMFTTEGRMLRRLSVAH